MILELGGVYTVAFPGDLKKPRPGILLQADEFIDAHRTVLMCPLTTYRSNASLFRPPLSPNSQNGLERASEVMVDKITPVKKDVIGARIGALTSPELGAVYSALINITGIPRSIFKEGS